MTDGRRILITGIAHPLAGALAARLEADERVSYVGGIDLTAPAYPLERSEFIRADLRNPLVAKVIDSTRVDTIVHLAITAEPSRAGGRGRMKELNVIGTMQLLAAAQRAERVRTFVMKSSTAVYGSHYRDPALFREDVAPQTTPRTGYTRDAVEVEGYARAFGRQRSDVTLSILRFANFVGPSVMSPLTRYLSLPVVPTVLGYDPRLQLCHTDDALEVLYRVTLGTNPGIFNVAGPGIVYLSQAIRLAGKPSLPVALPLVQGLGGLVKRFTPIDFTPEQLTLLQFGRVGDISRLRHRLGYEPKYSTRAALEDFLASDPMTPLISRQQVAAIERRVGDVLVRAVSSPDLLRPAGGAGRPPAGLSLRWRRSSVGGGR